MEMSATSLQIGSKNFVTFFTPIIVASACAGFSRLGAIPVIAAGLVAWPGAKWLSTRIDRKLKSFLTRFAAGVLAIGATLVLSTTLGLLIGKSFGSVAGAAPRQQLTESDLVKMAKVQNANLPINMSEHLELTHIGVGPGLRFTYDVRILSDHFSPTKAQITEIQTEAVKEACARFSQGLKAGITYVMAYNAPDGKNLFKVPVTKDACTP
jgi:hypothetical protein